MKKLVVVEKAVKVLTLKTSSPSGGGVSAFLAEYKNHTTENPFDPRERIYKEIGGIEIYPWEGRIHISAVRSFEPKKGSGSIMMKFLTDLADKHKVEMELEAVPFGNKYLSQSKLIQFYEKHGFKVEEEEYMIYEPRPI